MSVSINTLHKGDDDDDNNKNNTNGGGITFIAIIFVPCWFGGPR
jgi:hypothetical protein